MNLYPKAIELLDAQRPFAWATVVRAAGSTPQKAGAKAIFEPDGTIWGTLGGGCLEAESRTRALRALDQERPVAFDLRLDDDFGWDDGLICGGTVRVFVDPDIAKNRNAFRAAEAALAQRQRGILCTMIEGGSDPPGATRWIPEAEIAAEPNCAVDLVTCLEKEVAVHVQRAADAEPLELYLEPVTPAPQLLIAGAGHVGRATAHLGAILGFEVTVIDDRTSLTDARHFPDGVRTVCADIAREVGAFPIASDTYILIVTRGHRNDASVLKACVHSPAAYIGMIGSRRKVRLITKGFADAGIATEAELERVFAPVGLDIGAVTVPEIAASIAAQLVAVRRGRPDTARIDAPPDRP